jgi:RecA-family ATPase
MAEPIQFPRADKRPRLQPFNEFFPSQILAPPPAREWLVDAILPRRTVALLAGAAGIGKSLLLQQLLTASAIGQPWLGRHVEGVGAFGLFCEDDQDELERRQLQINEHYEIDPPDLELKLAWRSRKHGDAVLMTFERQTDRPSFTPLWHQLWALVEEYGFQLIGLDTAAVVFGGNENFRSQVTAFVTALAEKADDVNGAVIINAHPNRNNPNAYSGSTAWLGSCRLGMSLGRPKEFDEETGQPALDRVLRGLKANYGPGGLYQKMRWQKGVFVVDEPDPAEKPLLQIDKMDLDYRMLAGLKKVRGNGGIVPADVLLSGSMPRRARATTADLSRLPLNALYDSQERLLECRQVLRVMVKGKCLIRPADGAPYDGEAAW